MNPSPSLNPEQGTFVQVNGLHLYVETRGSGTPVIPNADHFTMAQQFDGIVSMMQNFMKRVIQPDHKAGGFP
jgi:hypothetical protein